jgi:hypothetical protein
MKRGVAHSLVTGDRVICQDQKDLNTEIKIMRCDLIFHKYPEQLVHSLMKPGRSNHPSSGTIYHGMIINPYVRVTLGTASILGPFSKLNIQSVEHR